MFRVDTGFVRLTNIGGETGGKVHYPKSVLLLLCSALLFNVHLLCSALLLPLPLLLPHGVLLAWGVPLARDFLPLPPCGVLPLLPCGVLPPPLLRDLTLPALVLIVLATKYLVNGQRVIEEAGLLTDDS